MPAPVVAAGITAAGALGSAALGSRANNRATAASERAAREALAFEREQEQRRREEYDREQEQARLAWEAREAMLAPRRAAAIQVLQRAGFSIPNSLTQPRTMPQGWTPDMVTAKPGRLQVQGAGVPLTEIPGAETVEFGKPVSFGSGASDGTASMIPGSELDGYGPMSLRRLYDMGRRY